MVRRLLGQAGLFLGYLLAASTVMAASQAGSNGGYFRIGEKRLEATHVIAVVKDAGHDEAGPQTLVYLSDVPLDAASAAAAFDSDDSVRMQLMGKSGGYVQLCIDASGDSCGLYFSPEGFNSSGAGTWVLTTRNASHIAGSWVLKEPDSFFDETYDFDLRFDVAITPSPGKDLPANGGEPGKAYLAYISALAKGNLPALRQLSDHDGGYRFPQDDESQARESLKSARDGAPVSAKIERGRIDGVNAVLWVAGVDRDDMRRRGRVQMHQESGNWQVVRTDLGNVD